jgi:hypothetical protein
MTQASPEMTSQYMTISSSATIEAVAGRLATVGGINRLSPMLTGDRRAPVIQPQSGANRFSCR